MGEFKVFNETLTSDQEPVKVAKRVNKMIRHSWDTSYDYNKVKLAEFPSKELSPSVINSKPFIKCVTYVSTIVHRLRLHDFSVLPEETFQLAITEIKRADEQGDLCLYTSVLLYSLLKEWYPKHRLKFVQGFYMHRFQEGSFPRLIAEMLTGVHVFLTLDGSPLDVSLQQIGDQYDDTEEWLVTGVLPEDTRLFGYEESEKIIDKYRYRIVKKSGLSEEEWMAQHKKMTERYLEIKLTELGIAYQ